MSMETRIAASARGCADEKGQQVAFEGQHIARAAPAIQRHSTNHIERLNDEIKRRTDIVGIFPNEGAVTRLIGAIVREQSDEWATQRALYMPLEIMAP